MTYPNTMTLMDKRPVDRWSIQRTLILTMGPSAAAIIEHLPPALGRRGTLASAVALLDVDSHPADLPDVIREKLGGISRAGGPADLAANGYTLNRLRELSLVVLVDVADRKAIDRVSEVAGAVAHVAQEGWGLDTRATVVALADDWAAVDARVGLRAMAETAPDLVTAVIPLNRVNELGLELDGPADYTATVAAIVEALVATPLGEALQWFGDLPPAANALAPLTTIGLARWAWEPEPLRDYLSDVWRNDVIDQWLALAGKDQAVAATQQAAGWFGAQNLLPPSVGASLERALAPYAVPVWPVPYPWQAERAIDQWRNLSAALTDGRSGAVELILDEWAEWLDEQEKMLRVELAALLDREPVAGLDLAGHFLSALVGLTIDAGSVFDLRRDQMEEQLRDLVDRIGRILAAIDSVLRQWPAGSPVAWLGMLARPWRWPKLAWEYWTVHKLAQEAQQLVAAQADVEREQVLAAVAGALYEGYEAAVRRAASHLDEARDMLAAARAQEGVAPAPAEIAERLTAPESPDLAAIQAANALGGLGRLAYELDESVGQGLRKLGRDRYQFLLELPAVAVLERMATEAGRADAWWQARWAEATPLWLYDDAAQTEASRAGSLDRAAICAAGVERLRTLLGLPDRADWRWLSSGDERSITIMRWRTGVTV